MPDHPTETLGLEVDSFHYWVALARHITSFNGNCNGSKLDTRRRVQEAVRLRDPTPFTSLPCFDGIVMDIGISSGQVKRKSTGEGLVYARAQALSYRSRQLCEDFPTNSMAHSTCACFRVVKEKRNGLKKKRISFVNQYQHMRLSIILRESR